MMKNFNTKSFRKKAIAIILELIILGGLFGFVFSNTWVSSESMENTLMKHDVVFGFRLAYLFGDPQRGDVIAFKYPVDKKTIVIKRIIGLPGETIDIKDGKIFVNGSTEAIQEDYLAEEWVENNDGYHIVVPEESYFMLGDNRNISYDSRFWDEAAMKENMEMTEEEAKACRFVKKDQIVTKLLFTVFPFTNFGSVN